MRAAARSAKEDPMEIAPALTFEGLLAAIARRKSRQTAAL